MTPRETAQEESWSVEVCRNGDSVVTIASNCLSGRDISDADAATIRKCAEHLLAFVGSDATLLAQQTSPIQQVDLPADAAKLLRDNLWELYGGKAESAPTPEAWKGLEALCEKQESLRTIAEWHEIVYQRSDAVPELLRAVSALAAEVERLRGENEKLSECSSLMCPYEAEVATLNERNRSACQTLIEAIGSIGPENVEDAAKRVAAELGALKGRWQKLELCNLALRNAINCDNLDSAADAQLELERILEREP